VPQANRSLDIGKIEAPRLIEGEVVIPLSVVVEGRAVIGV